jgi:hypothetical protein
MSSTMHALHWKRRLKRRGLRKISLAISRVVSNSSTQKRFTRLSCPVCLVKACLLCRLFGSGVPLRLQHHRCRGSFEGSAWPWRGSLTDRGGTVAPWHQPRRRACVSCLCVQHPPRDPVEIHRQAPAGYDSRFTVVLSLQCVSCCPRAITRSPWRSTLPLPSASVTYQALATEQICRPRL